MRQSYLLLAMAVTLSACASGNAIPGAGPTPVPPARGSIVWIHHAATFAPQQLDGSHATGLLKTAEQVIAAIGGPPKCGVELYAVKYNTVGVRGEAATASAGFFVPGRGCTPPFTLVAYGQGTNFVKEQKISNPSAQNIQPAVQAAIFASHGYAMAATDYLGLGYSDYSFQPYLVVDAEAAAVIDAVRAIRRAARQLGVPLSRRVFLTGHSQGGQTSLGTQKAVESTIPDRWDLIADAPSSGPYALTQTTVSGAGKPGLYASAYSAYMVTAYHKTYGNVYRQASEVFQQPYAGYVNDLLPVATYADARGLNGKTLPVDPNALYLPQFRSALVDDPQSPIRLDLAANDLLDGWTPKAPVYFCGGSKDPEVDFRNSILAYRSFRARGASVQLLDVNPYMPPFVTRKQYHDAVLVLCHTIDRVNLLDAAPGRFRLPDRGALLRLYDHHAPGWQRDAEAAGPGFQF